MGSYSIFRAEVPVNKNTSFDWRLFKSLLQSDVIWVAGQALTHCVNFTLRDMLEYWPKDENNKITFLCDCSSSIPSFEHAADKLLHDMKEAGVKIITSELAGHEITKTKP